MAQQGSDYPAVVQAQSMDAPYQEPYQEPVYEKRTKKQTKKKPKASRHIELMEWLPTLPQLFAYMGFTQFLIMFWVFVGECANDLPGTWNLVMMWITVIGMTCIFFVYNFLLAKKHILKSVTATIFAFTLFVFMFFYPVSHFQKNNYIGSHNNRAVLVFFRMVVVAVAVVIYSIAYIEDLGSGPVERVEVVEVRQTTIENVEAK